MATAPQAAPLYALCDGTIFTGEAMVEGHALVIQDGGVLDIVANAKIPPTAQKTSCAERILAPGYIDVQVNGGGNILFNNMPTAEACIAIAKAHQRFGTTRILPTLITDAEGTIEIAIEAVRKAHLTCPNILGIHIEGPHLSTEKRGVHKSDYLRAPSGKDMQFYQREGDEVMLVTVAPENVTPQQIKILHDGGVIISLGHTHADANAVRAALAAGASGFTHLFNGMSTMSAREPGVAGVALDDAESWCGLIVDNYHVSPEMVRLAIHAKAPGKIILVSDAMPPAASTDPQDFELYGQKIRYENGRCIDKDGRLAGAAITLSDAVKNCIRLGVGIEESLRMASTYPAAFIGMSDKLGKLLPGYAADVVGLDYRFNPQSVWYNN